jgi:hypothetical protein
MVYIKFIWTSEEQTQTNSGTADYYDQMKPIKE